MAFEGLKDQLKERWADLTSKIQENSTFNNLREKFESQTPTIQKAIVFGSAAFAVLILLSFPWSYVSESQDLMSQFQENRDLIKGLLHASRAAKEPSPLPPPVPGELLKARVEAILKQNRLVPDQIGEMAPLPDRPAKELAPPVVIQTGLAVQLKKLNVEQIIALGNDFQNMGPGTKLMGLDVVQTAGQSHYYDIVAHIVNFALPELKLEEAPTPGKRGLPARRPPKSDEESGE